MKSFLTGKEPRERLRELILEEHVECGCQCPPQVRHHYHHRCHHHRRHRYPTRALSALGLLLSVSQVGQDFLLRRSVTLTETAVTRKRKVEKSTRRCQIDCLREGYKRAIDEKTDFRAKIRKFCQKKRIHFLRITMFRPQPGNVVQRKKYRFTK